jgi:hypothetical protein
MLICSIHAKLSEFQINYSAGYNEIFLAIEFDRSVSMDI